MQILIALMAISSAASAQGIAQKGIEVPNAIIKQHNNYVRCQDEHFDIRSVRDEQSFIAEVEKAITACKDQKAALTQEAETILASTPDYRDPGKRQDAIAQSFDGYDQMRREMARGGHTK